MSTLEPDRSQSRNRRDSTPRLSATLDTKDFQMLTIGLPGFAAFAAYAIIFGLFWRLIAYTLAARNADSPMAKAMLFVH